MRFKSDREKAGGRLSKKPLVDRLKAGAAVLAISFAGCTMDVGGAPIADSIPDNSIVDSQGGSDSRPDKTMPDTGHDFGSPDKGIDSAVPDSFVPDVGVDTGPDSGVDFGPDSGAVCPGVTNKSSYGQPAYVGTPVTVGGYSITNTGAVNGGIKVDIDCGSNSSSIDSGVFLPKGGSEVIVQVPADGKKIRLKNISNSSTVANLNMIVETL